MTKAVSFFTKTGVLGVMCIGDMLLLATLEDGEFVGCIWVGVEEGGKVKGRDNWSLRLQFEVGVSAIQFGC